MTNKDDIQAKLEELGYNAAIARMARNAAMDIIAFTDRIAKEREEKKRAQQESVKQYVYEQAYKNKYGSLNYIKHF